MCAPLKVQRVALLIRNGTYSESLRDSRKFVLMNLLSNSTRKAYTCRDFTPAPKKSTFVGHGTKTVVNRGEETAVSVRVRAKPDCLSVPLVEQFVRLF